MVNSNPYQTYHKTQIETASQGALILMLFDGAIKFSKTALRGLADNNYEISNENIIKAQAIIQELIQTLDREKGGELANNLFLLYDYIYWRLINANVRKSSEILTEVVDKLTDLRQTWKEVIKISRSGGSN